MPDEITYGRMRLDELDAVLEFLKQNYPDEPRQSDPQFWRWHFLECPRTDSSVPVWLARLGERIVGQLAAIPVELNVGDLSTPAVWIVDAMASPELRRRGIMKGLVRTINREYPYMLGSATRRQHSPAMLEGLGWTIFSAMPRYRKLLFPGNAVGEIAAIAPLRAVSNTAYAPFRPRLETGPTPDVRVIEQIDERFDALWARSARQWECSVSHGREFLHWQFGSQPGKKFDILAHFDGDEMDGFVVLFFRKPVNGVISKAAVSDICYTADRGDDIIRALLRAALSLAMERQAGSLVTDIIDRRVERHLVELGFTPITSGLEVMAIGPGEQPLLYEPDNWHLTRADSDISIFEHPNL